MINPEIQKIQAALAKVDSAISLRFDIGGDYDNGSLQRILQVRERAYKIFEETFADWDFVFIYSQEGLPMNRILGAESQGYLYSVLKTAHWATEYIAAKASENCGDYIRKDSYFKIEKSTLVYRDILKAIGNHEQGRKPSISQSVYFISPDFEKVMYLYDDRGCDVYGQNTQQIRPLYNALKHWILDYHRAEIDSIFNSDTGLPFNGIHYFHPLENPKNE